VKSPEANRFGRVAIVGLGLMGGSLARALKGLPNPPHIRATSRTPEDIQAGMDAGALDGGAEGHEELLRDRDLVVYATPIKATLSLMEEHRPFLHPGTVITDLVSLKEPVLSRVRELGLQDRFVGSHPMVGGTGSGFSHSREGLFGDARVWLVPGAEGDSVILEAIRTFWLALGARPAQLQAEEHDAAMAWVSHLPQLASNALALALRRNGLRHSDLGSGGRDMTRLAGSGPEMWRDLLEAAPEALPHALGTLEKTLSELRESLLEGDLDRVAKSMDETRGWVEEDS